MPKYILIFTAIIMICAPIKSIASETNAISLEDEEIRASYNPLEVVKEKYLPEGINKTEEDANEPDDVKTNNNQTKKEEELAEEEKLETEYPLPEEETLEATEETEVSEEADEKETSEVTEDKDNPEASEESKETEENSALEDTTLKTKEEELVNEEATEPKQEDQSAQEETIEVKITKESNPRLWCREKMFFDKGTHKCLKDMFEEQESELEEINQKLSKSLELRSDKKDFATSSLRFQTEMETECYNRYKEENFKNLKDIVKLECQIEKYKSRRIELQDQLN